MSVHTVDCKCKEEGYCKSCHAVPRWPSDILLWQRTDITDLSWFRRLREEQRSFSYGLNKIKDRKVIAALETTRGKGAAGEAGGHPGGKSGQPAADSQRHKLPIAVARHSPSVAKEIVRELIPTKHLYDVLRAVAHSVRFAHQETPSKWGLRLKRDSIMLKVGFVEVLQLGEGWFHILVESDRISKEVRRKRHLLFNRDARYRHAPGCETCDIDDIPKIASGYSDLLPAHEEAIRIAARSRIHTSTTKDHSPGLITFISQELNMPLFQPAYVELSETVNIPEDLAEEDFEEGDAIQVLATRYERDPAARQQCISHYGVRCIICDVSLSERYGPEVDGLIHVHHLTPLASVGKRSSVDPIRDLRPVCPNCHAVIHATKPPRSLEQVKEMLQTR